MQADTNPPCPRIEELAGTTLVSELFEIQNHKILNNKSIQWAANLECLSKRPGAWNLLELTVKPNIGRNRNNYIAVSYPWEHTPRLESNQSGSYWILHHGVDRENETRDEVLRRVLSFANYIGVPRFWIDRECVDQGDPEEHQKAMDSMDLVYSHSEHPLGLLATTLHSQEEVNLLQELLWGTLIKDRVENEFPVLVDENEQTIRPVLNLLKRLSKDRWWRRAWIFQEEYRSSTAMCLLIRHDPGLLKTGHFGTITGEMCFGASSFREQATVFLLASQKHGRATLREKCNQLLERFAKYNILYHFTDNAIHRVMSSRIFADIECREVGRTFDLLPIAANSCDYAIRFTSEEMAAKG